MLAAVWELSLATGASKREGRLISGEMRASRGSRVKPSPQADSIYLAQPSTRAWRFLDLFRVASSRTLTLTAIAVAVAWIPPAALSALRGGASFLSFLTDYATQSRFLIVIPVLILAEKPLHVRLTQVVHHFETFFVQPAELPQFQVNWASYEQLRNSRLARVSMILLTYTTAIWLAGYLNPRGTEFVSWWTGGGGYRYFSPAGTWAVFVSYAVLVYFTFLWLWRQFLWARFLRATTRLNLRLIAAHPDHLGGLGFLEASLLGQLPFSFCLGVGLAGAIANRVLHAGQNLMAFRFLAPALIATVLLICVAPHFLFTRTLMQMRRSGMLRYGALARTVGEQFERKWLGQTESLEDDVLGAHDFSATTDLFSVVENIDKIRVIPISLVDLYAIVIAALVPAIPVVLASIPFNVLIRAALKLLV